MADRLANLIERARTWPQEAQEQAVASLEAIEEEMRRPYELSEDDRRAMTAASPTRRLAASSRRRRWPGSSRDSGAHEGPLHRPGAARRAATGSGTTGLRTAASGGSLRQVGQSSPHFGRTDGWAARALEHSINSIPTFADGEIWWKPSWLKQPPCTERRPGFPVTGLLDPLRMKDDSNASTFRAARRRRRP